MILNQDKIQALRFLQGLPKAGKKAVQMFKAANPKLNLVEKLSEEVYEDEQ